MKRRQILFFLLIIVCLASIFLFSSQNSTRSNILSGHFSRIIYWISEKIGLAFKKQVQYDEVNFIIRKCAHFTIYFILGICMSQFLRSTIRLSFAKQVLVISAAGFILSSCDEIHQAFVAGRTSSFRDVCIDTAGVFASALLTQLLDKHLNQSVKKGIK